MLIYSFYLFRQKCLSYHLSHICPSISGFFPWLHTQSLIILSHFGFILLMNIMWILMCVYLNRAQTSHFMMNVLNFLILQITFKKHLIKNENYIKCYSPGYHSSLGLHILLILELPMAKV